jgi:hypothetical protein
MIEHQAMRDFIILRIRMMLDGAMGAKSPAVDRLFVYRPPDMFEHPLSKRSLKRAELRPKSEGVWPIGNRDCWYEGFDYTTLSDTDLVLFYERIALNLWRSG